MVAIADVLDFVAVAGFQTIASHAVTTHESAVGAHGAVDAASVHGFGFAVTELANFTVHIAMVFHLAKSVEADGGEDSENQVFHISL